MAHKAVTAGCDGQVVTAHLDALLLLEYTIYPGVGCAIPVGSTLSLNMCLMCCALPPVCSTRVCWCNKAAESGADQMDSF